MTDQQKIEALQKQVADLTRRNESLLIHLNRARIERETLLRVIKELWDGLCLHEPDLSQAKPVSDLL